MNYDFKMLKHIASRNKKICQHSLQEIMITLSQKMIKLKLEGSLAKKNLINKCKTKHHYLITLDTRRSNLPPPPTSLYFLPKQSNRLIDYLQHIPSFLYQFKLILSLKRYLSKVLKKKKRIKIETIYIIHVKSLYFKAKKKKK